jgi:hypothetical protein
MLIVDPDQLLQGNAPSLPVRLANQYAFPLLLFCGLLSATSLVLRFRRSRGVERQQLKWFAFAAAVTIAGIIFGESDLPFLTNGLGLWVTAVLTVVVSVAMPLAAGAAILRYHLFDIDIVIRRTLLYTLLTVVLALVYFASIIVLQALFAALSGVEESPLAVVASTLFIAALFAPLRGRLQKIIDRRFFRSRYIAQQVLERFAVAARDETDLEKLTAALEMAIIETMHPDKVTIWLGSTES